jgi:hypothetical protein
MTRKEELIVFQNILAQSELGLDDPNLIGKFAKAKAFIHRVSSIEAMNAQNNVNLTAPQPPQSTISPEVGQSTAPMPTEANSMQNQAPMQQEGQGSLVLP